MKPTSDGVNKAASKVCRELELPGSSAGKVSFLGWYSRRLEDQMMLKTEPSLVDYERTETQDRGQGRILSNSH